jgi:hypothetical protein
VNFLVSLQTWKSTVNHSLSGLIIAKLEKALRKSQEIIERNAANYAKSEKHKKGVWNRNF